MCYGLQGRNDTIVDLGRPTQWQVWLLSIYNMSSKGSADAGGISSQGGSVNTYAGLGVLTSKLLWGLWSLSPKHNWYVCDQHMIGSRNGGDPGLWSSAVFLFSWVSNWSFVCEDNDREDGSGTEISACGGIRPRTFTVTAGADKPSVWPEAYVKSSCAETDSQLTQCV